MNYEYIKYCNIDKKIKKNVISAKYRLIIQSLERLP